MNAIITKINLVSLSPLMNSVASRTSKSVVIKYCEVPSKLGGSSRNTRRYTLGGGIGRVGTPGQIRQNSSKVVTQETARDTKELHSVIQVNYGQKKKKIIPVLSSCALLATLGYSLHTRKWREEHLMEVSAALHNNYKDSFYLGDKDDQMNLAKNNKEKGIRRDLVTIESIIARTGLMGKFHSVKDELDRIRVWHQEHGYRGGIVLRELNVPLYSPDIDDDIEGGDDVESITSLKPTHLKQRECYYLYYEIKPNGHTLQQIFCRGTTISEDVYTCIQSKLEYDEELGIHIHKGFRDHANRLVRDVLPLLGPPFTKRSTVELSGHSLGGAVAFIVAMKLKKMGYNVTKVTAIAGARFCDPSEVHIANQLLPKDALRIEDDLDGVPFLPPWASPLGDKLWLVNDMKDKNDDKISSLSQCEPKYVPRDIMLDKNNPLSWVDGCWTNIRLPEIISSINTTHRITSHRSKIQKMIQDMKEAGTKK